MANRVIANSIKAKIEALSVGDTAIIVLKGIPLSIVDSSVGNIDLAIQSTYNIF